jgi:drug/metabolite transporter (DMT)-like permease
MTHIKANFLMLTATFIWGTAFVSQTTGMGAIGPFTFSFARFFFASLTVLPLMLMYERKNFSTFLNNKNYIYLSLLAGLALFGGMGLQQYSLLKSQVANASFLSTLYVPFVSLISRFVFRSQLHWIIWIAVLLCLYGSYLLSSNQTFDIQQSDSLLFVAAFCFAIHIIIIDIFMKKFYSPFTFGFIQYIIVFLFSIILAFSSESPTLANIQIEWFEIIYTGVFSAGIGYTLQIIAQSKASPAPAAIILSLESVFGTLAAWILINQVLDTNKILGCIAIFIGVIIVQLVQINTNKSNI